MEWQTVGIINTSSNYVFSPVITGTLFKLNHLTQTPVKKSLKVAIRQVFEENGNLALFDYKLINCKNEQDIILFNLPQGLTNRKLAFKRVDNLTDDWTIEIQTLVSDAVNNMPSYPSTAISRNNTNKVIENTIAVSNVVATNLSPFDPHKLGTTVTNVSNFDLFLSIGTQASFNAYDKILGTNETFETPFNWSGDVWAISNEPQGADEGSFAKVKDFSW